MSSSHRSAWGPHPAFAVAPVVAVLGVAAWTWHADREPLRSPAAVAVTAFRPESAATSAADLPIEVVAGVPSERTLHLWQPGRAAD